MSRAARAPEAIRVQFEAAGGVGRIVVYVNGIAAALTRSAARQLRTQLADALTDDAQHFADQVAKLHAERGAA